MKRGFIIGARFGVNSSSSRAPEDTDLQYLTLEKSIAVVVSLYTTKNISALNRIGCSWLAKGAAAAHAAGSSSSAAASTMASTIQQSRPTEADPAAEVFEICDGSGNVLGTELRSIVHKTGLLHKAVYCFVFDTRGRLLIQRRSSHKSIGPNQWDLSVAEHLSPGETFHDAAVRGLQEELGIAGAVLPQQPLGPMHRRSLVVPGKYLDNELVESYALKGFKGEVNFNPAEVCEVKYIELPDLVSQMAAEPGNFTEWFRDELALLCFFGCKEANGNSCSHQQHCAGDLNLN